MVGFLIPQMAALPGLIADITKETMSHAEYTAIKNFALKNNAALAGSTIRTDIDNGVSPYVAIGTQATIIALGAGLSAATFGLGIPATLGLGLLLSIGIEYFGIQTHINSFLSDILGLPVQTSDGQPELHILTGYQVYKALMQVFQKNQMHIQTPRTCSTILLAKSGLPC